jgi:two-component system, LytTR family, sensor kinase
MVAMTSRAARALLLLPIAIGMLMALTNFAAGSNGTDARLVTVATLVDWAAWSPLIAAVRRIRLVARPRQAARTARLVAVLQIGVVSIGVLLAHRLADVLADLAIWGSAEQSMSEVLTDALFSASIVSLCAALQYRARSVERETEAAALAEKMAVVRLRFLVAQLQPHFLFNALNGALALLEEDAPSAGRMVADLAEFVEASFEHDAAVVINVGRELMLLHRYVTLEGRRFPDLFRLEASVDEAALQAQMPPLLLQPLIENAIRHGMRGDGECAVQLEIRCRGARLEIEIEDSGTMFSGSFHEGIGLANTRQRLSAIYPNDHQFRMSPSAKGGARVEISIPCRVPS